MRHEKLCRLLFCVRHVKVLSNFRQPSHKRNVLEFILSLTIFVVVNHENLLSLLISLRQKE
jgi:hypothetical protein